MNNVISVSYRMTREELSTLPQGLRLGALPGAPVGPVDEETAARALEQIAAKELAIVTDGAIYVNKLIHFLLQGATQATAGICITDGKRTVALWSARGIYILGDFPEEGECALTPLQSKSFALEALTDTVCRMARPLWAMHIFAPDRRLSIAAEDPPAPQVIAQRAMDLLKDNP